MKKTLPKFSAQTESQIIVRAEEGQDPNEIKLVWSTGFKGLRSENGEKFYEELEMSESAVDMSRLNKSAPLLAQHDQTVNSVIGVIKRAWLEDGLGYAIAKLSSRDEVKGLVTDVREGILRNVSVGYRILELTEVSERGAKIPTYRATKWQPSEISIVAIGFDPHAQTLRTEDSLNEVQVIRTEEPMTENKEEQTEVVPAEASGQPVIVEEQAPQIDVEEVRKQAVEEFKTRSTEIRTAVKAAGIEASFADELIERGLSTADASKEIFKKLEAKTSASLNDGANSRKETGTMTKREMAEQALLNRVQPSKFKVDGATNPYKQARFIDLIEAVVERNAGESDTQFVKRAIVTADLAQLLANVSNKIMGQTGPEKFSFSKWTMPIQLRDFKETPIVQLGAYSLQSKTEGGDYAEASLTDSDEKITLRERGLRFSISQKAIINDDLGALKMLPMQAQSAGFRDIEGTVYDILNTNGNMSDGVALFHATHGNLISSAGGVPSVASLEAVNLLFAAQTDASGTPLDLRAKYLIVPPQYEVEARQLASATMIPNAVNAVNPYAGELEVVVSSRISGNVWYAAADREQLAAIVTATLEGQDEPMVSTEEHFRSSNLEMKVEFPNAAAAANYRSIVKVVV